MKTQYERLNKAFKELRKNGYFARQNFLCCQSCGWSAIPEGKDDKAVFYHNQETENKKQGEPIYLCWDGDGNEIVRIFSNNGILSKWDGSKDKRIIISNYKD